MADINKEDIKLMQSQRLDDTPQGGGQMTAHEVVDGAMNNLFADISRLDRVYGRVSIRKAYPSVQTSGRETYYGAHVMITEQAKDPHVSVCFFSDKDWFSIREDARNRIESYLVKGPLASIKFWGNHYIGTSVLRCITNPGWPIPQVGDVLVIIASQSGDAEQYVRVIDVSRENQEFVTTSGSSSSTFYKDVVTIKIGTQLKYDVVGSEVYQGWNTMDSDLIYTTVAADASRYYGVATLAEDASAGELLLRVDDIRTHLVPSAASSTPIVDAGVGSSVSPVVQTRDPNPSVTRQITFHIYQNAKLHIGESILPGTFSWSGGIDINDGTGEGNIYNGSNIIGSIDYATGVITFSDPGVDVTGTGTATYTPACAPRQISHTGAIIIDTNNRDYSYVYRCDPLPQPKTLVVEYLAGGKWYRIWDIGNGKLRNTLDESIGSGSVSYDTGSVTLTLGAMPDVDSKIIFYWAKSAEYYDFSGGVLPLKYDFILNHEGIARNTFVMSWLGDGNGPGPNGEYAIIDNGRAVLVVGDWNGSDWVVPATPEEVGTIQYATGRVQTSIGDTQYLPTPNSVFTFQYNYGTKFEETIVAPPRDANGHITFTLTNTPIVPGTFEIEWHTLLQEYDPETRIDMSIDPVYIFQDDGDPDGDGIGEFVGDVDDGTTGWIKGTVNYSNGTVTFHPDRTGTFPHAEYKWTITEWMHPGVVESRVFDHITYLPAFSQFPTDGDVYVRYCTQDGTNNVSYTGTLDPIYIVRADSGMELVPGSLSLIDTNGQYLIDGYDGKLYVHDDGVDGTKTQVGTIHYVNKTVTITSDSIGLRELVVVSAVGTGAIDPTMSMVFRTPGAPIQPGSFSVRATTGAGTVIEGTTDFSGNITGPGVFGHVNFETGLAHVGFGEWVPDDSNAQSQEWYSPTATDGAGNVWKPYQVRASSVLINCVITSYLPLDPTLLGLDPVRLPLDGKVPIFRDGYIIVVHNTDFTDAPHPLTSNVDSNGAILEDVTVTLPRQNLDVIEAYSVPTDAQIADGSQTCNKYIPDGGNYEVDLQNGTIKFLTGFVLPKDSEGTLNKITVLHRIEDMLLASDVQITGHIGVTSPLQHDYPALTTQVSSVLPIGDMQARIYNEFVQMSWYGDWLDYPVGTPPLASYNFVDYPIHTTNRPSIKERWLLKFTGSRVLDIVGERFGMLVQGVDLDDTNSGSTKLIEYPTGSGQWYVGVENKQYPGEYYWLMSVDGFGYGWASGNCIRFNQDAANFPIEFVRTTLQAPAEEAVDHYTIQIRGDSS